MENPNNDDTVSSAPAIMAALFKSQGYKVIDYSKLENLADTILYVAREMRAVERIEDPNDIPQPNRRKKNQEPIVVWEDRWNVDEEDAWEDVDDDDDGTGTQSGVDGMEIDGQDVEEEEERPQFDGLTRAEREHFLQLEREIRAEYAQREAEFEQENVESGPSAGVVVENMEL